MEWRSSEFRKSRDVPAIINDFDRFSTHMFMEKVDAIRPRTQMQKCTESGRRLGYNSNILLLHAQHFCTFILDYEHFPVLGGSPRTPQGRSTRGIYNDYQHFLLLGEAPRTTRCCATHGIYNILLTFSYSREGSADHSMSSKPWNLQHICRIFRSSGKLRGPLDVMQRMDFAIYD